MISGKLYNASRLEPEHNPDVGRRLAQRINLVDIGDTAKITELERKLFGAMGEKVYFRPPIHVDFGSNIYIGDNSYANMNCVFLDVAPIRIGNDVMLGPNVQLITATHPIDAGVRVRGLEYGLPITIGDGVWLGAGVIVNPGVTIGARTIVGSGAVVTKDLPADVIAVGNPARVLRAVTEDDRHHWENLEAEYQTEI